MAATVVCFIALALLAAPHRVLAATIAVDTNVIGGAGCDLAEAITSANTDTAVDTCTAGSGADIIDLDASTIYNLTATDNVQNGNNGLPVVSSPITFSGNNSTIQRVASYACPSVTDSENFRVFYVGAGGTLTLDDLTVRNGCTVGNSEGPVAGGQGGGLYNGSGTVTLSAVAIISNTAILTPSGGAGGGIYNTAGTLVVDASQVISNTAGGGVGSRGGGIANIAGGSVTVQAGEVVTNAAAFGGGLHNSGAGSTITVKDYSRIAGNSADIGAGIGSESAGQVNVQESEVSGNVAMAGGGGIGNTTGGHVAIQTSEIISNTAGDSGGGLYSSDSGSLVTIDTASRVAGNWTSNPGGQGGGVYNAGGRVTILESTVEANRAEIEGDGGGLFNSDGGALTVDTSNVVSNTAGNGGGLYNQSGGQLLVTRSAILSNSAVISGSVGSGGGIYQTGAGSVMTVTTTSSVAHNLADDGGGINNQGQGRLTVFESEVTTNTANLVGGGVDNGNNGRMLVDSSRVASNTVISGTGGGLANGSSGALVVQDSIVLSNTAVSGGGLYNRDGGHAKLLGADVFGNTSTGGKGGGLYQDGATSVLTVTAGSRVFFNAGAGGQGGGLASDNGRSVVDDGSIRSNTAITGGGLYHGLGQMSVSNADVMSNTATSGGGLYSGGGQLTLLDSTITGNVASNGGGGYLGGGQQTMTGATFTGNTAGGDGGGIYNSTGQLTMQEGSILDNVAGGDGGGVFQTETASKLTIGDSRLLRNLADGEGGAIYQNAGQINVAKSCIVHNSVTAAYHSGGTTMAAANNWWGAANGPSGAGPGDGDSISAGVTFAPFRTTASVPGCPTYTADLTIGKVVMPAAGGNVRPGQPVSYTLTFGNSGPDIAHGVRVTDTLAALLANVSVVSSTIGAPGIVISDTGVTPRYLWFVSDLAPGEGGIITITAQASATLNADGPLANTARVGSRTFDPTANNSSATNLSVSMPRVSFSSATYNVAENQGPAAITVTLNAPNPFAPVQVTVTPNPGSAQVVTIPAGQQTAVVQIPVFDDKFVGTGVTIQLGLSEQAGAALGAQITATLTIDEDDVASLSVGKSAGVSTALPDESIGYTYRVTNTGNVTLTGLTANDDKVGAVTLNKTSLSPGQAATGTANYGVTMSDLAGSLQNTVTVTATGGGKTVTGSATVSVIVGAVPALQVSKSANVAEALTGGTIVYSYRITNTGNITLTDVAATDDKLGEVTLDRTSLALGESATGTANYLVQLSDLPGPLVNVVDATASGNGQLITGQENVSVALKEGAGPVYLPSLWR